MSKKTISKLALALLTMLGAAESAMATVVNFDSTAAGTYSALGYGPVAISFLAGSGNFEVQTQAPGSPLSGRMLISYFTNPGTGSFQATFAGGASSVSIDFGDYSPSDEDEGHLRAYDAANNLLDSDFVVVPASGPGATLSVSSGTAIARVEWNETGDFAGAVYWDNLTYEAAQIPEPASLVLVALGLGMAGAVTRRRKQK